MLTIEKIQGVITKLPHSKSRVPYTYHHDYLRMYSIFFSFSSRSEVFEYISSSDIEVCKKK